MFTKMQKFTMICLILMLMFFTTQSTAVQAQGYLAPNESTSLAGGATWYVATTGSDTNDCITTSTPCLTINGAIGKAVDGDTVLVAGGAYISASGNEVVLIEKSITLSGGWDSAYAAQSEISIIDGQSVRRGILVNSGTVVIDRFTVQNGFHENVGGGIFNISSLTLNNSAVSNNKSLSGAGISNVGTLVSNNTLINKNIAGSVGGSGTGGGGIYNSGSGTVILSNSIVRDNTSLNFSGGGIVNTSSFFTINSSIIGNTASSGGGIESIGGNFTINNSTVSSNISWFGGGIYKGHGNVFINNSTVVNNTAYQLGGGISSCAGGGCSGDGTFIQNSIIANNKNLQGASDCAGVISSDGHNIVGDNSGCTLALASGDLVGTSSSPIDPKTTPLPLWPGGHHALLAGSPAIDAGNTATCLSTDQRGVTRPQGAVCDIGAYEYVATPGAPELIGIYDGSNQERYIGQPYLKRLAVSVLDGQGTPVSGINVTFAAPLSGSSGIFADTNSNATTVQTNSYGVATASTFTANTAAGAYQVNATGQGLSDSVDFSMTNSDEIFLSIQDGSNQQGYLGRFFIKPLSVLAVDVTGAPVGGVSISFGAPSTGASGTFADTLANSTTAITDVNGIGTASKLRANFQTGNYNVGANASGSSGTVNFSLSNLTVSTLPTFIGNGDFEDPTSLGYSWFQYSTLFGTPLCTFALCGTGGGTAGPHSGSTWVWFGGAAYPYNESASITQFFNIPKGPAFLRFYLWIGAAEAGSSTNDRVSVLLDNEIIYSVNATQQSLYPSYKLIEIDLGTFQFESNHSFRIEGQTWGKIVNFNLDDVSMNSAIFADVAPDYWSWSWIERLYSAGVTGGCGPSFYCPDATVTRAQMAVFLLKGIHGSGYTPPAVGVSTGFNDVPTSHWAAKWIKQLAVEGITSGCGTGIYCPESPVTRAQMAVFLVKTFNLP